MLKVAMVALATGGILRLGKSFIDAASTSERFATTLKVVLGDVGEANRLFEDMAIFAAKVPFEFEQIMGAATDLAGVVRGGRREIGQLMPIIADIAAATGLTIRDTTANMIRMYSAGAGAADTFRERGILAALGFQAGVAYSAEETMNKVVASWRDGTARYIGATAALADNWSGQVSMMADKWFIFRNWVMDAAPFDYLKAALGMLNKDFDDNVGGMESTAKEFGQEIVDMAKEIALGSAEIFDAVTPAIKDVGGALGILWDGFESLPDWVKEIGVVGAILTGRVGLGIALGISAINEAANQLTAWSQKAMQALGASKEIQDFLYQPIGELFGGGKAQAAALPTVNFTGVGKAQAADMSATNFTESLLAGLDAGAAAVRAAREAATKDGGGGLGAPPTAAQTPPVVDAKKYAATIKEIERLHARLPKTYDQMTRAAAKWRDETMAGLDRTKAGYSEFADQVDDIYRDQIISAYDDSLAASKEWQDGVTRGLRSVRDQSRDMASQFESAVKRIDSAGEDTFINLVRGAKTVGEAFQNMADVVINEMLRIVYRKQIAGPLAEMFGGVVNGFFGSGIGGGGGGDAGLGPRYQSVQVAHAGGMIGGADAFASRPAAASLFDGAPRFHGGGGIGPGERPIIGKVGEVIGWPNQLARAFGGSATQVTVIDQRGAGAPDVQVNRSRGARGIDLVEIVVPAVERAADGGRFDDNFAANFGAQRQTVAGA
ncbi:MAG TPA: hypothetical protein ENI55_06360 [Alphaproteobacteria bacterium]|nr:hypothetical protein [Alphaproteobacteria bacterium]